MSTATRLKEPSKRTKAVRKVVQKARGVIHPRVQLVGPEHFGVVCFDCAKARSKWMLCDFYGNLLVEPTVLTHAAGEFTSAIARLREAIEQHRLQDCIVSIERTGNYHLPIKRAYAAAGFETRIVHPFATKQFRQPADPGNKTDDTDLAAIFRATVAGFSLTEAAWQPGYLELRLLTRHRRDLIQKRSKVCCQIREHLEAIMPGYAACFVDLWDSAIALELVRHFPSPQALLAAGFEQVANVLKKSGQRFVNSILEKVFVWANLAAAPDVVAAMHHRVWQWLCDDYAHKCREIAMLETDIAHLLVRTPYVLLLSFPGINVVSAGELAGEMGPIENYRNAKAITGRAGIFPTRYQSDQVDLTHGSLVRCANRSLRAILLLIADNLLKCNAHFRALAAVWKAQGKAPQRAHVKIACRFTRILYQIVAGKQVFQHPSCRQRDYILAKLFPFLRNHDVVPENIHTILQTTIEQLPTNTHKDEAIPLQPLLQKILAAKKGPQPIGDLLTVILAKLGDRDLQLKMSEEQDPSSS